MGRSRGRGQAAVLGLQGAHEGTHHHRIELGAGAVQQLAQGGSHGQRRPVGAVGGHGIVGVGHGEEAGPERDLVSAEAEREDPLAKAAAESWRAQRSVR